MEIWSIIIISLLFSAFFSGMQIAYSAADKIKIEVDKKNGGITARIISGFIRSDSGFNSAMLVGNIIALVVYAIFAGIIIHSGLEKNLPTPVNHPIIILILQVVISSMIIIFLAELLPRILFRINANQVLVFFALPALIIYYLLYPFVFITLGISDFILKNIFRVKISNTPKTFDSIDINDFLEEYGKEKTEKEEEPIEVQIFRNAIEFPDIKLRESMIPRTEIVALEESENLDIFRKTFSDKGFSKIIIYRKSIDNIVGYVHAFDFFKKPADLKSIIRPVMLVPETMHVNKLLRNFIQQRRSIAVVVDEFGGTSGLITTEDIMEEIFGEIDDEYDTDDTIEKRVKENEYIFSARLEIDYLNEKYNLTLPESDEYETLGGLIINQYESIPEKDEIIKWENYEFRIVAVSQKRIEQVQLKIVVH